MLRRWAQRWAILVALTALFAAYRFALSSLHYHANNAPDLTLEVLLVGVNPSYAEVARTLDAVFAAPSIAALKPHVSVYTVPDAADSALHELAEVRSTPHLDAVLLSYLARRYASLPDFVLFAPAVPADYGSFSGKLQAFDTATQFLPLVGQFEGCSCLQPEKSSQRKLLSVPGCAEHVKSFRHGQFIVSKSSIELQPAEFYQDVLQTVQFGRHNSSMANVPALQELEAAWSRAFACSEHATGLQTQAARAFENESLKVGLHGVHAVAKSRIIWMLWLNGWDDAPWLALRAVESWRLHNPTWNVVLLTEANLATYLVVPTYFRNSHISPQARSDVIRLHLLADHGGVWADATVVCTQPLDSWIHSVLEPAGFWMYHGTGWPPPKPATHANTGFPASWFMAAARGSYLARSWVIAADNYWATRTSGADNYFWMDALFRGLLDADDVFAQQWSLVPYVSCEDLGQSHMFLGVVHKVIRDIDIALLETNPPFVLKLSHHKLPKREAGFSWFAKRTAGFSAAHAYSRVARRRLR